MFVESFKVFDQTKLARKSLFLLKFCQIKEILKTQFCWHFWNVLLWVILMEMKVSQVGGFQITSRWICYSIFFRYLTYSVFHETFVKKVMKKLLFFSSNFKNPFHDVVYYRKLGCLTLWYWNGAPLNVQKVEKFVRFWGCFFRNKNFLTFWVSWTKYFGNDFS